MGLLIWLPLHGNLTNYGSSPVTFSLVTTGGGISAATSGGKTASSCYQRTTINTVSRITSSSSVTLDGDFTMACWCYATTAGDAGSANGVLTNHNHADNSGSGITLKYMSANDCRISCNTGNGSSRTFCTYYGTTNIYGAWHHLCLTYKKSTSTYRLYVDGVCENQFSYGNLAKANKFNIFDWSTGFSDSGAYRPNCRINDVRVYDHCLSKREVKLLSQGLVAHYKLSAGSANNLLTNTSYPTTTAGLVYGPSSIVYDNDLDANVFERKTTATSESYIGSIRTAKVEANTKYTFSCDIKVDSMVKSVDFFWLSDTTDNVKTGTGYVDVTYTGGRTFTPDMWHHFTWTFTTKANVNTGYIRIDNNGTKTSGTAASLRVTNLKLEKGEKDTGYSLAPSEVVFAPSDDCSGYCRNLTQSGTIPIVGNSARFDTCCHFNQTGFLYKNDFDIAAAQWTINFWLNPPSRTTAQHFTLGTFSNWTSDGFGFYTDNGSSHNVVWRASGESGYKGSTAVKFTPNTWTMVTFVATGTKCITYLNGVQYSEITYGSNSATHHPRLYLGNSTYNGTPASETSEEKMSDFRFYVTALSPNDIEELYKNAGSVTREGNLIAHEFKEVGGNSRIKKSGVFVAEDFSERGPLGNMKIKVLPDNSAWARVFYHKNNAGTILFASADEAKSANTANKYSCLHLLDSFKGSDGKYEFMLTFPTEFPNQYNRWKQTNNPCNEFVTNGNGSAVAAGYTAISVAWSGNFWGGLTRQNSNADTKSACYLSGSVGHSNWFYAIGAYEKWDVAIPGPNDTAVSETELWVRIDTLPANSKFSILKEQFVSSSLLHEI